MTTTDPRLADCVLGGYSVVLTRPRPGWARAVLPDRIISRSRYLVGELADVWLDAYREREGDMETVYGQVRERFGLDRAAVDKLCRWYQGAARCSDSSRSWPTAGSLAHGYVTGLIVSPTRSSGFRRALRRLKGTTYRWRLPSYNGLPRHPS
jgi:hypothetical protein